MVITPAYLAGVLVRACSISLNSLQK
ncbi:MAG: hypothetical protein ACD_45C00019G0001, partial [uncultured bacterium]